MPKESVLARWTSKRDKKGAGKVSQGGKASNLCRRADVQRASNRIKSTTYINGLHSFFERNILRETGREAKRKAHLVQTLCG